MRHLFLNLVVLLGVAFSTVPSSARELLDSKTPISFSSDEMKLAPDRIETFHGRAEGSDDALVYTEDHIVTIKAHAVVQVETSYRNPSGELVATIKSDFSHNSYLPDYRYHDTPRGFETAIQHDLASGKLRIERHSLKEHSSETKVMPYESKMIGGQGIFFFMLMNLEHLCNHESKEYVSIVVPTKLAAYPFRVYPSHPSESGNCVLKFDVDNWFLRIFASDVEIEFDTKAKRLVEYRGASSIGDAKGAHPNVKVRYIYSGH